MSKNDNTILALQEKIGIKEKELNDKQFIFKPKTTCILYYDGEEYNLHTLSWNEGKIILCKLIMLRDTYEKCQFKDSLMLGKFDINDWIDDIVNTLRNIEIRTEEQKLNSYKNKLDKLLSEDKRTELLLQEIEDDLK